MAWRVDPSTDLVLNLHLQPSGKPEVDPAGRGAVLHRRRPHALPDARPARARRGPRHPSGRSSDFVVTDHYDLPVDVEVLAVYPHAHYLGRDVKGWATLPDGRRKWLIWIRGLGPQLAGRLPVSDARRPAAGLADRDAHRVRQLGAERRATRATRRGASGRATAPPTRWAISGSSSCRALLRTGCSLQEALMRRRLEKYPGDYLAHANLASVLEARGRPAEALAEYRRALEARPDERLRPSTTSARSCSPLGRHAEALRAYRDAVRADPAYANARYNLGNALVAQAPSPRPSPTSRRPLGCIPRTRVRSATSAAPSSPRAAPRRPQAALERAVALDPRSLNARFNLAKALLARGRMREALRQLEEAQRIAPADDDTRRELEALRAAPGSRLTGAAPSRVLASPNARRVRAAGPAPGAPSSPRARRSIPPAEARRQLQAGLAQREGGRPRGRGRGVPRGAAARSPLRRGARPPRLRARAAGPDRGSARRVPPRDRGEPEAVRRPVPPGGDAVVDGRGGRGGDAARRRGGAPAGGSRARATTWAGRCATPASSRKP